MTGMLIDQELRQKLLDLGKRAMENPVDIRKVIVDVQTPMGKTLHSAQMAVQSLEIPFGYRVVFSVEHGQPIGPTRHMSLFVERQGRIPNQFAIWMLAEMLGFWGPTIQSVDRAYVEPTPDGYQAVHILQRVEKPAEQQE